MKRPGFSLVEMVTVIAIISILSGVVMEFMVSSIREHKQLEVQASVQGDVNLAIDKVSRVARSATMILETKQTNLKIRGYPNTNDPAPSEINFYIDGHALKYSVIPPTGSPPNYTYNPSNAKVYLLLARVNNSISDPLFYYYDDMNTKLSFPVNSSDVRVVEFTPTALDSLGLLKGPIKVTTTVMFRNFKTNL